jgi:hypothetical protein
MFQLEYCIWRLPRCRDAESSDVILIAFIFALDLMYAWFFYYKVISNKLNGLSFVYAFITVISSVGGYNTYLQRWRDKIAFSLT